MDRISVKDLITEKAPQVNEKLPKFLINPLYSLLSKAFKEKQINEFLAQSNDKYSSDFIDELFESLDFNYYLSVRDRARIPDQGRLIIVANHPLGGLDGLAILRAILEVRKDVKIVVNDMLMHLDNIKESFLPVDLYSASSQKRNMLEIKKQLKNEGVVILFPSGEVSRLTPKGIVDRKWSRGAISLSMDMEAPVLPVHISGRNSSMFYGLALIKKEIGTFLLSREIFAGKNKEIKLTCGDPIPSSSFGKSLTKDHYARLLKKHLYDIGSGRRGIFKTEKTIIHPVDKQVIKRELMMSADIGKTKDGKSIYLVRYDSAKNVLREISRVREHTYRKVGEGTGKKADTDKYDRYYDHIVLWDDNDLEIVGSYRIGVTRDIIQKYGTQKLYNSGLYTLNKSFDPYIEQAVELGRSFVQPKYWGSSALDYLWQGIGAYLREVDNTRYLFGAVSISDKYPDEAKAIIIEYYKKWYSGDDTMVSPVNEVTLPQSYIDSAKNILSGKDYEEDYRNMKTALRNFSLTVPVLLRKYSDVCHYGGVKYLSYTINTGFNNAIDCFVLVDTWQMKPEFKSRYMTLQKSLNRRSTGIENAVEKNIKTIL